MSGWKTKTRMVRKVHVVTHVLLTYNATSSRFFALQNAVPPLITTLRYHNRTTSFQLQRLVTTFTSNVSVEYGQAWSYCRVRKSMKKGRGPCMQIEGARTNLDTEAVKAYIFLLALISTHLTMLQLCGWQVPSRTRQANSLPCPGRRPPYHTQCGH